MTSDNKDKAYNGKSISVRRYSGEKHTKDHLINTSMGYVYIFQIFNFNNTEVDM
jgi:hypothetical protein